MHTVRWTTVISSLLLCAGCVSQGKYDEALAKYGKLNEKSWKIENARRQAVLDAKKTRAELSSANQSLQAELDSSKERAQKCQVAVDESTAMIQNLRTELEKRGKNADNLLAERGFLASALVDAKARLEELRKAQAASESRARLFKDLALRFKHMIDAGELRIVLRDGRMVLVLPNDVLFDSGRARIKPTGEAALTQVAETLRTLDNRHFQIAGHTDNEPIRLSGYESNWELSTARALQVTRFLVKHGMQPQMLSAAGYGEFDPVAANDNSEDKARNRRIEITLMPNIDELVSVPDAG